MVPLPTTIFKLCTKSATAPNPSPFPCKRLESRCDCPSRFSDHSPNNIPHMLLTQQCGCYRFDLLDGALPCLGSQVSAHLLMDTGLHESQSRCPLPCEVFN